MQHEEHTAIGHCRKVRGLEKSMVVFCLFEKLRYSNERSTKYDKYITQHEEHTAVRHGRLMIPVIWVR